MLMLSTAQELPNIWLTSPVVNCSRPVAGRGSCRAACKERHQVQLHAAPDRHCPDLFHQLPDPGLSGEWSVMVSLGDLLERLRKRMRPTPVNSTAALAGSPGWRDYEHDEDLAPAMTMVQTAASPWSGRP